MNEWDFEQFERHFGHTIKVVEYGDKTAIECRDCQEIIFDEEASLKESD